MNSVEMTFAIEVIPSSQVGVGRVDRRSTQSSSVGANPSLRKGGIPGSS
jgi:hypothetical protein